MVDGLQEVAQDAQGLGIAFVYLVGDPLDTIPRFALKHHIGLVVTDLYPIEPFRSWKQQLRQALPMPMWVVDGHNTVPVWEVSLKREYAARTIRPKIWRLFEAYHQPIPQLQVHPYATENLPRVDWQAIVRDTNTVSGFPTITKPSGAQAARAALQAFVDTRLGTYDDNRNDPSKAGTSQLSAYFHFGHLSCTEVITAILAADVPQVAKDVFLEEFVIRKELSDNYCTYTPEPLSLSSVPDWAQKTIALHHDDPREYLYDENTFLNAQTHDAAWNAAQTQLVQTGFMHGYMRMYWAKKILEWTPSAQEAIAIAVRLNDLLQLDGRDPNGYVGIMWSMAGVHDRPWQERSVFGTIRYMNANGLRRKFKIDEYIARWNTSL